MSDTKDKNLIYLTYMSKTFSYPTTCSNFKWIEPLFFLAICTQTHIHRQTDTYTARQTHTDGHDYSIVAVDKPQL